MAVPLYSPFIKRRDMDAVLTTLIADNLVPGSQAEELVGGLLPVFGCESGRALREYARSIELVLSALGLAPGARVGLSALAPRVWLRALEAAGLVPVLVDVHPANPTLNAAAVAAAHAESPLGALVAMHSLGYLADMRALLELGIPVVEDMGQAFGHKASTFAAGTLGQWVILSMESDGIVTAGGGCLVFARGRRESQALSKAAEDLDPGVWMGDVNAALARAQVSEAPAFLERRRELRNLFGRALLRGHHKVLAPLDEQEEPVATLPVIINSGVPEVLQYARKKNMEAALAFHGSILQSAREDDDPRRFPNAYSLMLRCVLLPLHPGIRAKEAESLEKVCATLP